ncbi:MAG: caspase family protein [Planctomycetaceae bacterium]
METRKPCSLKLTALVCMAAAAVAVAFPETGLADDAEKQQQPRVWALLVAASSYPELIPRYQLTGPPNDAKLMSTLLRDRFGVSAENIVVLAEGLGAEQLPTRSRIETEFRLLAERVRPGDQVLILIAGHGSQQPDSATESDERDGLDEIFLPRDTGAWNGAVAAVANSITDDELNAWLSNVRRKGTHIFFIADTCHSGTIARGASAAARDVPTDSLGIPPAELARAAERAAAALPAGTVSRGGPEEFRDETRAVEGVDSDGSLIALYAALPHEKTFEQVLPAGGIAHGWLSWALCKALSESGAARLTYRELAQRVQWHYEQHKWADSHPVIEGSDNDLDREVLGIRAWPGRSRIVLQRGQNGDYSVNAGVLHGAGPGSVLAAYATASDRPAGFVRVTRATAVQADVEPIEFAGQPKVSELPVPARCELKYQDLGDCKVWVSVDVTLVSGETRQSQTLDRLNGLLQAAAGSREAMLRLTPEGESPEWYIIAAESGDSVRIASANELLRDENGRLLLNDVQAFGPYPVDDALSGVLLEEFSKLARAANLRRIAELETGGNEDIRLDVRVERLVDQRSLRYSPLSAVPTPELRNKDVIRVVITNPTKSWVDVTVLYIQTDGCIRCFFPKSKDVLNRLGPGESHTTGRINIDDTTIGLEDLVVIGIPRENAGAVAASFEFLSQPSLKRAEESVALRSRTAAAEDMAWESPLGVLSRGLVFNEPGLSRGGSMEALKSFVFFRVSWNIVKSEN